MLSANTASGGGSVSASPSQASYAEGTVVVLTATPQAGWVFVGWSGDASGTANPLQVTMSANKVIVASFAPALPTPEATISANFNSGAPLGMRLFGDARVDAGRLKLQLPLRDHV